MTKASNDTKQVFARAVALYRRGKVAEAAKLFRKVAAAGGDVAARARRYLARITAESARTKTKGRSSRGTKRKIARPKAAKKAKAPRKGKSARPKVKRSADRAARRGSETGDAGAARPDRRPQRRRAKPAPPGLRAELAPEDLPYEEQYPEIIAETAPGVRPDIRRSAETIVEVAPEIRPDVRPDVGPRPEIAPDVRPPRHTARRARPEVRPEIAPTIPEVRPEIRPELRPEIRPELRPERDLSLDELEDPRRPAGKPDLAPRIVRRTPHMDIHPQTPLQPGADFTVDVFVDQQVARAGEVGMDIEVPAGTRAQVHLIASEHFLIKGPAVQPITIDEAPRSDAPPFHLAVKPAAQLPAASSPYISALFMHDGRPCGMVRRAAEIAGVAALALPPSPARVEITPGKAADLHITVVAGEEKDGRKFTFFVHTPHIAAYREEVSETWILPNVAGALVRGYMNEFTAKNSTPAARIAALRGAGLQLFDASPNIFRKVFWELIDAGAPLKDIAIVSEEPFIPWELMVPNRRKPGAPREQRKPLGLEFRIGRWTTPDMIKPPQKLPLTNSYVIAPNYADARKRLQHAKDEAEFVAKAFDGEPIAPAGFADIERKLKAAGRTLVHFICHGLDSQDGTQIVELDNNERLTSTSVEGMDGLEATFNATRPIVFLNACEVGRPAPALVGLGGFAASFIRLGASAVIAPLWSVKDSIAHEIAMAFYNRVKAEPETPFAEIFRTIRENAYNAANGEDSYAAYCFYGDPAAFAARA